MHNQESKLIEHSKKFTKKQILKIRENVYFAVGYGASTCTLVEGVESCTLVDTLDSIEAASEVLSEFKNIVDKPIKNIIYTHYQHPDHTSGTEVFVNEETTIWGRKPEYPQYGRANLLKDIYMKRAAMQFGAGLTEEESVSLGIGPSVSYTSKVTKKPYMPNKFYSENLLVLELDGVKIELIAAQGETDDQTMIWFPEEKVLCCGDNYFESWPNLSPIRGGQYRDVDAWIKTLEKLASFNAEYLLPGHTMCVSGSDTIKTNLTNYKDAIEYVLVETLNGLNSGITADELANTIKLPSHLENLPYLQEYYGTIPWTIKSIATGYLGWFDGNPTNLFNTSKFEKASKTLKQMGGAHDVINSIKNSLLQNDEQWALELCDILIDAKIEETSAKKHKIEALNLIARKQISANARHYYIKAAKELALELNK